MNIYVLGIDPGHDGGACLLEPSGRRSRRAWTWHRTRRSVQPYDFCTDDAERQPFEGQQPTLYGVGCAIARELQQLPWPVALIVEGLSVHRKASPDVAIELGRTVGLLTGPLLPSISRVLASPLASSWRPVVLGIAGNASSEDSERAARRMCEATGLSHGMGSLIENPHACEAMAIARMGWLELQGPAQMQLGGG